jgi:tRNA threonylcarbamoyl adenosine modification protein (Sua5/YciO/YrdC/YwlC family)
VSEAEAFERCLSVGGVAVFPADTVYGLACDPENRFAVERLYLLKRRPPTKPSAVMFFDLERALSTLPELGERTRRAMQRLLPGPVSLLVPNPARRFPLACGEDPLTLGVRVPHVPRLAQVSRPVLQSSANRAGAPDARRLDEIPTLIRSAADLVIDGGELPGTASTVIDLRRYDSEGEWRVVREGAVPAVALAPALAHQLHFEPSSYLETMRTEVPAFDRLQDAVAQASGASARRVLELGTGTGETARRVLERHPEATLVGIDESVGMLEHARRVLPAERTELRVGRLEDPLPDGPFDLVVSALCVHHLGAAGKAELFARVAEALAPGGRFVLGDVVLPEDPRDAQTPLTPSLDHPSPLADQLAWLREAGFSVHVCWTSGDLAVVAADAPGADIFDDSGYRASV